ncbi:hypothetical protein [Deinococcus sp.]|uniref:hypothetical protein n=1 Tax=Deinococcus sp. TaxID=47478 RepID=UPI003B5CFA02
MKTIGLSGNSAQAFLAYMQLTYASGFSDKITEEQLTTYKTVVQGLRACLNLEQGLAFSKVNVAAEISPYLNDKQVDNALQFMFAFLNVADDQSNTERSETKRSELCREAAELAK